jgi:LCP family protein required for cell wall assembly
VFQIVAIVGANLAAVGVITAYSLKQQLDRNLRSVDLSQLPHRPAAPPDVQGRTPLNILLLGATSRTNNPDGVPGGDHDNQSDTIMLAHISADRRWASVVSLPRDLMVHIPSCKRGTGFSSEHQADQINNAFEYGGPACSIATIEGFSNLRIDHFVEIDFQGFKDLTNAVGGVPVCLPKPVDDPKSGLHLAAGPQVINGDTALAFVRTRYGLATAGLGNGGDLARIRLQQQFISSLLHKLSGDDVLLNPVKLYSMLDTATRSITTDTGLGSTTKLAGLAHTLTGLPANKVSFITVPNTVYPPDPNRLQLDQPAADQVFTQLRQDRQPTSNRSTTGSPVSTDTTTTGTTGATTRSAAVTLRIATANPCTAFSTG